MGLWRVLANRFGGGDSCVVRTRYAMRCGGAQGAQQCTVYDTLALMRVRNTGGWLLERYMSKSHSWVRRADSLYWYALEQLNAEIVDYGLSGATEAVVAARACNRAMRWLGIDRGA